MPDNPIISGLRKFYEAHYNGKAPKDDVLDGMAQRYAGKEQELWTKLYKEHYGGKAPDEETIKGIVTKFPNDYSKKKEATAVDGGTSGSATTAGRTYLLNQNDIFRANVDSVKKAIDSKYKKTLDDNMARLQEGKIDNDQFSEISTAAEKKWKADLALVNLQEQEGPVPDKMYDGWEKLQEEYKPFFPTERVRLKEDASAKLPDPKVIDHFVDYTDSLLASSLGLTKDAAKQRVTQAYSGVGEFSGNTYGDMVQLRSKLIKENKDKILAQFPSLPKEALDIYVNSDPRKFEGSDFSDPKNPYSKLKYSFVDNFLDREYPDLNRDQRQMLRKDLIDEITNAPLIDKAREKTKEQMEERGLKAPKEVFAQYDKELKQIDELYTGKSVQARKQVEDLQDEAKRNYTNEAQKYSQSLQNELAATQARLQALVNDGKMSYDDAVAQMEAQKKSGTDNLKNMFDQYSTRLAQQQREVIQELEKERQKYLGKIEMTRKDLGLNEEDGTIKASEEYINTYARLFEENLGQIQQDTKRGMQEEYNSLSIESRIGNAVTLGYVDMFDSFGGGLKWAGMYEAGNFLTDIAERENQTIPVDDLGQFDSKDMTKASWWIDKGIRMLPTTLSLMAIGMGTTGGVVSTLGRAGMTQGARTLIGSAAGAAAMRPLEGFMEAGQRFNEDMQAGKTVEEASKNASNVFSGNMALYLSDLLQLGMAFSKMPVKIKPGMYGRIQKLGTALGEGVLDFATEGGEEVYQGWLQEKADNPMLSFMEYAQSAQGIEAGVLGGISGIGLAAMSGGGGGQATVVHKLLSEHASESGNVQDVQKRYFQLVDALQALKEKGILNQGELEDAMYAAGVVHKNLMDSAEGLLPIDFNSQAHREYTTLSLEAGKLRRRISKNTDEDRAIVYNQALRSIETRMRELIDNPSSKLYSVDGVPVTEKDFSSLMANAKVREFIPASKFRAENDLPLLAIASKAMDDEELARQVAQEFISSTEEVNSLDDGIEYLDKKIADAANGRNAKDTVDRYTAIRDVLAGLQDKNARVLDYVELVKSGQFDERLQEMGPQEAKDEYEKALNEIEKTQDPEFVDKFKADHADLNQQENTEETFMGLEHLDAIAQTKDSDELIDTFNRRIDDMNLFEQVKNEDPELYEELNGVLAGGGTPSMEQMGKFVELTDKLLPGEKPVNIEDQEIVEEYDDITSEPLWDQVLEHQDPELHAEVMSTEEPSIDLKRRVVNAINEYETTQSDDQAEDLDMVDEPISEPTPSEREIIDAHIEDLKGRVKDGVAKWFTPKLGLTPFSEQDIIDDAQLYKDMVELGYWYIRSGVRTIADFAAQMNVQVDNNLRNVWAAAKELDKHRHESIITMESKLSTFDSIRELVQDKDIAIKNLQNELERLGVDIDDASDLYKARELAISKTMDQLARFNEKIIGIAPHLPNAKAINEASFIGRLRAAFPEVENIEDHFAIYLYAKHAPEFNARVQEEKQNLHDSKLRQLEDLRDNASTPQAAGNYQARIDRINAGDDYIVITNASGMSTHRAEQVTQWYESQPDFADFESFVNEFRKEVIDKRIDLLESAGMLSAERAKALRDGTKEGSSVVFKHYVPLKVTDEAYFADFDPARGGLSRPGAIQSIKGTSRFTILERNNPMTQAILDHAGTIKDIERNSTNRALYNLMKAQPDPSFWDVIPSRAIVTMDDDGQIVNLQDLISDQIKSNSVTVVIDGKLKYLYFKPMLLDGNPVQNPVLRALNYSPAFRNYTAQKFVNAARMYIGLKRNLITTYNIAFGIPNFTKDVSEALGNIETVKQDLTLRHVRTRFIANIPSAMAAVAKSPWDSSGRMGAYWDEANAAGMKMSWAMYDQADVEIQKYNKAIKKYHEQRGAKGLPLHAMKVVLDRVSMLNDIMENTTRLALYAALRDQGVSTQKAASAAKNITLNFEKKGTGSNVINALWLFANAGIQSVARGGQLVVYRKAGRYVFNKRGLALGTAVAFFSFLNKLLFDLWDKEDKDKFLSDFDRENNLLIYNPVDPSKPLKFPKPYSFIRIFMNIGENAYDAYSGKTPVGRAMLGHTLNSILAFVDPIGGSQPNKVSAWMPEIATIPVEWGMNQKWNGTPFYYNDRSDPDAKKYTKKTPPWIVETTDAVNNFFDFNNTGDGFVSISPALVEYVGQQFFGGVGAETIRTVNLVDGIVEGEGFQINEAPILRRFMVDLDDNQRQVVTKFFELTKRRPRYGITEYEIQTAREAYKMIKENEWLPKQTAGRLRNDFKKKWGVSLK